MEPIEVTLRTHPEEKLAPSSFLHKYTVYQVESIEPRW